MIACSFLIVLILNVFVRIKTKNVINSEMAQNLATLWLMASFIVTQTEMEQSH